MELTSVGAIGLKLQMAPMLAGVPGFWHQMEPMLAQIERRAFEQCPYLPSNATWREIWVVSFFSLMFEVDALKFGG